MQLLNDRMSQDVQVISPDMMIGDAAKLMHDGNFGMLPVEQGARIMRERQVRCLRYDASGSS